MSPRTDAALALLGELSESPLPGASYARDVVSRRLPDIEREAKLRERERIRSALVARFPYSSGPGIEPTYVDIDVALAVLDEAP